MGAKTHFDPSQSELFTHSPYTGVEVPNDVFSTPEPSYESKDGPSVSLMERSNQLLRTMDALGQLSMLGGFQIAADTPGIRGRELEPRYDSVDAVVGHTQDKQARLLREAKQAFARASGLPQIITDNPDAADQAKANTHAMFQDFLGIYADSRGRKPRDQYRRQLKNQQRRIAKSGS